MAVFTRLWNIELGQTAVMRSKEEAHDYRYFPDPDLLPLLIADEWIDELRSTLQELPQVRQQRFIIEYNLPEYDAGVLTKSRELADYFESCVQLFSEPKTISNFIMGELLRELNQAGVAVESSPVSPDRLVELLKLVHDGTILRQGIFNDKPLLADLRQLLQSASKFIDPFIRDRQRQEIGIGKIAIVVRFFFASHDSGLSKLDIPQPSFLVNLPPPRSTPSSAV